MSNNWKRAMLWTIPGGFLSTAFALRKAQAPKGANPTDALAYLERQVHRELLMLPYSMEFLMTWGIGSRATA